ncbi:conserved hypothetical protein [Vibrio coralliirubri]|uniref:Uncharacterized protein n=1 Tax=Vibrio atlanticus (strain LGP32) TaxID=575788 RepID=B7VRD4_VIBA3|nr:hypothetical protein VS_II0520 [Vibrio atlanticus]CDT74118.1 conserved hypothetical protein [Vibrio coralliirubri]
MCVHRIMAITSAFQADDAGSIPAARSNFSLSFIKHFLPAIPYSKIFAVC